MNLQRADTKHFKLKIQQLKQKNQIKPNFREKKHNHNPKSGRRVYKAQCLNYILQ